MKISIEHLAYGFAFNRGIALDGTPKGAVGERPPIKVIYHDNGNRQAAFVRKKFAQGEYVNESSVLFSEENDDSTFTLRVLRGCLIDYVTMLDNATDEFSHLLKDVLEGILDNEDNPNSVTKVVVKGCSAGEIKHVLDNLYPYN